MKKTIVKVEGMKCEGCEKRIENALLTLENVRAVTASYQTKTVEVVTEEEVLTDTIKEKIESIGFEVVNDTV